MPVPVQHVIKATMQQKIVMSVASIRISSTTSSRSEREFSSWVKSTSTLLSMHSMNQSGTWRLAASYSNSLAAFQPNIIGLTNKPATTMKASGVQTNVAFPEAIGTTNSSFTPFFAYPIIESSVLGPSQGCGPT